MTPRPIEQRPVKTDEEKQLEAEHKRITARLKEIRSARRQEVLRRKKLGLWSQQELDLCHFIEHYFGTTGLNPTVEEMKKGVGIKSTRGLILRLDKLEARGVLSRTYGKKRTTHVLGSSQYTVA